MAEGSEALALDDSGGRGARLLRDVGALVVLVVGIALGVSEVRAGLNFTNNMSVYPLFVLTLALIPISKPVREDRVVRFLWGASALSIIGYGVLASLPGLVN